jgi:hypothetical protein
VLIHPQAITNWEEAANVWGLIIGRSSELKSPSMRQALRPLRDLEDKARAEDQAALNASTLETLARKVRANAIIFARRAAR